MKKLFAFMLAAIFALTLTVSAAETESGIEWYEIELSPDNFGTHVVSSTTDDLTINDDGSVTVDGILLFGFQLPREIPNGETVVVKISGSAEDNFRVWLLGNNEKTCSNIYTMSDGGYSSGRFDRAIEFTAQDLDNVGNTEANDIIFKAKTTSDLLMNFTIESVTIYFCTMDEYVAGAIDFSEVVAFASEAESKLNALYDKLDDAEALEAGIAEIEEDYMPVLEGYLSLGNDDVVEAYNKLSDTIDDLRDEARLNSLAD